MTRAVIPQRAYESIFYALASCPSCTFQRWKFLKRIPLYKPFLRLGTTNEEVKQTVKREFPGRTIIINSLEDELKYCNRKMIDQLLKADVVAFDTETKPEYQLGKRNMNKVALIQVATDDVAILWRVYRSHEGGPPKLLSQILRNGNILKVGHDVQREFQDLYHQYNIEINNVIDTQAIAKALGSPRLALTALTSMFCGWTITKAQQRSNWERSVLTPEQISYAATDAWATLQTYNSMRRIMDRLHLDLPATVESSLELVIARNRKRDLKLWRRVRHEALSEVSKRAKKLTQDHNQVKEKFSSLPGTPKLAQTLSPTRACISTSSSMNDLNCQKSSGAIKTFPMPPWWNGGEEAITDLDTLDGLLWKIQNFDSKVWLWTSRKDTSSEL